MAVGAVTFHNDRKVKRFHVKEKDNAIVNRLNKTKKEIEVDHEAERQDRLREEGRKKKAKAIEDVGMPTDVLREYAANWRASPHRKRTNSRSRSEGRRSPRLETIRNVSLPILHFPTTACSCSKLFVPHSVFGRSDGGRTPTA